MSNSKELVFTGDDLGFIHGLIYLNPVYKCGLVLRLPNYRMERFSNACDVRKALPDSEIMDTLMKSANAKSVNMSDLWYRNNDDSDFKKVFAAAFDRIHRDKELPSFTEDFNLSECSPWLSKAEPLSVVQSIESRKGKERANIYTNIRALHSVQDDYIVVQETEGKPFGYSTSALVVKATVAFPPICEAEVWTIGWIQGVTTNLSSCYFDDNTRFAVL